MADLAAEVKHVNSEQRFGVLYLPSQHKMVLTMTLLSQTIAMIVSSAEISVSFTES